MPQRAVHAGLPVGILRLPGVLPGHQHRREQLWFLRQHVPVGPGLPQRGMFRCRPVLLPRGHDPCHIAPDDSGCHVSTGYADESGVQPGADALLRVLRQPPDGQGKLRELHPPVPHKREVRGGILCPELLRKTPDHVQRHVQKPVYRYA